MESLQRENLKPACLQVIDLQQQRRPIQCADKSCNARRDARYKQLVDDLLSLDCHSLEAVDKYLQADNPEE